MPRPAKTKPAPAPNRDRRFLRDRHEPPADPKDRLQKPRPVSTPAQLEARRDLFVEIVSLGISAQFAARAVRERTVPQRQDDSELAKAKRELAKAIGAPLSDSQVATAYRSAREAMADQYENDRPTERAAQSVRLGRDLMELRLRARQTKGAAGAAYFRAIERHEELKSKIDGTQAPVRLEVDAAVTLRQSLAMVIAGLTPDEQRRIVDEERELERRARLAEG